jgi:putrescine transport system permease protein
MSNGRANWFGRGWLAGGYIFLYIPIVLLVVLSFNQSRQDVIWTGFTLNWYRELLSDKEIIDGFILSLKIAFLTGTLSVILGTFAAFTLVKYKRFFGRTAFVGMVNAPLVMPEVIIGLSLLLLMVSLQNTETFSWINRGMFTILIGHALVGLAYATVVIQSRLIEMDRSIEEAAMDLGCRPRQVFFLVTLPNITQALMSAFLLTFTISLDDVVISQLLSGPGSSTMPIVIFSRARLGLDPRVNAVATLTILVVTIGVILSSVYLARAERRRQKEMSAAFSADAS